MLSSRWNMKGIPHNSTAFYMFKNQYGFIQPNCLISLVLLRPGQESQITGMWVILDFEKKDTKIIKNAGYRTKY